MKTENKTIEQEYVDSYTMPTKAQRFVAGCLGTIILGGIVTGGTFVIVGLINLITK